MGGHPPRLAGVSGRWREKLYTDNKQNHWNCTLEAYSSETRDTSRKAWRAGRRENNCGILMGAERKVSVLKRAVKTSLICKRKNKLPSQVVSCVGCQDHWRWWLHVYCKGTCLEWLGDEPGRAAVSALMTTVGPLKLWILNIYHTAPHPPRFLSNWSCCSLN